MTVDSSKLKVVGEQKFLAVVDAVNRRLTQDVIVGLNAAVTDGRPTSTSPASSCATKVCWSRSA